MIKNMLPRIILASRSTKYWKTRFRHTWFISTFSFLLSLFLCFFYAGHISFATSDAGYGARTGYIQRGEIVDIRPSDLNELSSVEVENEIMSYLPSARLLARKMIRAAGSDSYIKCEVYATLDENNMAKMSEDTFILLQFPEAIEHTVSGCSTLLRVSIDDNCPYQEIHVPKKVSYSCVNSGLHISFPTKETTDVGSFYKACFYSETLAKEKGMITFSLKDDEIVCSKEKWGGSFRFLNPSPFYTYPGQKRDRPDFSTIFPFAFQVIDGGNAIEKSDFVVSDSNFQRIFDLSNFSLFDRWRVVADDSNIENIEKLRDSKRYTIELNRKPLDQPASLFFFYENSYAAIYATLLVVPLGISFFLLFRRDDDHFTHLFMLDGGRGGIFLEFCVAVLAPTILAYIAVLSFMPWLLTFFSFLRKESLKFMLTGSLLGSYQKMWIPFALSLVEFFLLFFAFFSKKKLTNRIRRISS